MDVSSKRFFFRFNPTTKETRWTLEEDWISAAVAQAEGLEDDDESGFPIIEIIEGSEWRRARLADGTVYFFHESTGESSWDAPSSLSEKKIIT